MIFLKALLAGALTTLGVVALIVVIAIGYDNMIFLALVMALLFAGIYYYYWREE